MLIDELREISNVKSIGIFGAGISGIAAYNLLQSMKLNCIVYDEFNEAYAGFTQADVKKHHVIICSPSFMPGHEWVDLARKHSIKCIPELDLAYAAMIKGYQGKIIAVTGTNGKTTTVEFLTFILKNAGYRAIACGNIGRPLADVVLSEDIVDNDYLICEVSSFQASMLSLFSPDVLLWTNFYPNHLNKHRTMEEYFNCKSNLLKTLRSDQFFCGQSVTEVARKNNINSKKFSQAIECIYSDEYESMVTGTSMALATNRENFAISARFCDRNNIPLTKQLIEKFKPPKYRLEFVCKKYGKFFWNDSKSTTFSSLRAALNNFNHKVIWIGGGRSKGETMEDLLPIIRHRIEYALLIGETGSPLGELLHQNHIPYKYTHSIECAIRESVQLVSDTVLFSPAFTSFDQFKDYKERGKFFEKCIFSLKI
ncbi:MAG: UDP-N-acetylmuramoyl-L-alanine--D-glutamate ligase [Puniceicoccales bacterium]|jgi:UDP-N-acetylmuramoylalanine--D-glutamate ligase|nr:UDP-N-acetylmuramoyl-L-alanine--D-glutamate ligase [Puniceicoccales bacterium]